MVVLLGEAAYRRYGATEAGRRREGSLRSGGGRVDATGEWLVGAKGECPIHRPFIGPIFPMAPSRYRRDLLVALRLYGAEDAFYDQTWKPDDIVRVR